MTLPSVHAIHPAPGGSHGNKTEIYFHGGFVPVSPGHNSPEKGWAFSLEKNLLTYNPQNPIIRGASPVTFCEERTMYAKTAFGHGDNAPRRAPRHGSRAVFRGGKGRP